MQSASKSDLVSYPKANMDFIYTKPVIYGEKDAKEHAITIM
jgi:hypothetical protein